MPPSPTEEQSIPLREGAGAGDWSVDEAFDQGKGAVGDAFFTAKTAVLKAWGKTTRKMRAAAGILLFT